MARLNQLTQLNPVNAFQTAQSNALINQRRQQQIDREANTAPVRNQLEQLGLQQKQTAFDRDEVEFGRSEGIREFKLMNQVATALKGVPFERRFESLQNIAGQLKDQGFDVSSYTADDLSDDELNQTIAETQSLLGGDKKLNLSSGQRESRDIEQALKGAIDPTTGRLKPTNQLTALQRKAAIAAKLIPGAGTSTSTERIAVDPELTEKVATSQSKIKSAVKMAEIEAKNKGETITELAKAEAALPGIEEVVGQLKILSEAATFNLAGKGFDEIAKQFGYSTEGSTSKAKMVSIVDNQVLPLLKPIFGAAFTAAEGDRLRNAMLDPESTPDSRKAQLDAFLSQMVRTIDVKKRELESQEPEQVEVIEGATYHNPTTGEKITLVNGEWQAVQ